MSIYATMVHFAADEHSSDCAVWIPVPGDSPPGRWHMTAPDGSKWRRDLSQWCSCRCGPVYYRGSHILPTEDDQREGAFGICEIPGFIGQDPGAPESDSDPPHPWLRIWAHGPEHDPNVALLDRRQIAEVHAYLGEWLSRTKEQP